MNLKGKFKKNKQKKNKRNQFDMFNIHLCLLYGESSLFLLLQQL